MAAKVEKTSGLPLPKAKNVTPVSDSLMPSSVAIVLKFIHRKSDAAMPIVLNSSPIHTTRIVKPSGFALGNLQ